MKTTIGDYNAATGQVSVTFEHANVTHTRGVNAVLTEKGRYDPKATAARVEEVTRGVEHKIGLRVITNPPPVEEASPATEA